MSKNKQTNKHIKWSWDIWRWTPCTFFLLISLVTNFVIKLTHVMCILTFTCSICVRICSHSCQFKSVLNVFNYIRSVWCRLCQWVYYSSHVQYFVSPRLFFHLLHFYSNCERQLHLLVLCSCSKRCEEMCFRFDYSIPCVRECEQRWKDSQFFLWKKTQTFLFDRMNHWKKNFTKMN